MNWKLNGKSIWLCAVAIACVAIPVRGEVAEGAQTAPPQVTFRHVAVSAPDDVRLTFSNFWVDGMLYALDWNSNKVYSIDEKLKARLCEIEDDAESRELLRTAVRFSLLGSLRRGGQSKILMESWNDDEFEFEFSLLSVAEGRLRVAPIEDIFDTRELLIGYTSAAFLVDEKWGVILRQGDRWRFPEYANSAGLPWDVLLIPTIRTASIYVVGFEQKELRRIATDVQTSVDVIGGTSEIIYAREARLWAYDLATGTERVLSNPLPEEVLYKSGQSFEADIYPNVFPPPLIYLDRESHIFVNANWAYRKPYSIVAIEPETKAVLRSEQGGRFIGEIDEKYAVYRTTVDDDRSQFRFWGESGKIVAEFTKPELLALVGFRKGPGENVYELLWQQKRPEPHYR